MRLVYKDLNTSNHITIYDIPSFLKKVTRISIYSWWFIIGIENKASLISLPVKFRFRACCWVGLSTVPFAIIADSTFLIGLLLPNNQWYNSKKALTTSCEFWAQVSSSILMVFSLFCTLLSLMLWWNVLLLLSHSLSHLSLAFCPKNIL